MPLNAFVKTFSVMLPRCPPAPKVIQRPRRARVPVSLRGIRFRVVIIAHSADRRSDWPEVPVRLTVFVRTVCPFALL